MKEHIGADGSDRIRDSDARQARAFIERSMVDECDKVGCSIIGHSLWYDNITTICFICVASDRGVIAVDVIVNAIDLEVVGRGSGWQQEGQQEDD